MPIDPITAQTTNQLIAKKVSDFPTVYRKNEIRLRKFKILTKNTPSASEKNLFPIIFMS